MADDDPREKAGEACPDGEVRCRVGPSQAASHPVPSSYAGAGQVPVAVPAKSNDTLPQAEWVTILLELIPSEQP